MNKTPLIDCRHVKKTFVDGKKTVEVLKDINLTVWSGENIAIRGASGEGKSTLLHILGGLDQPTSGEIDFNGLKYHTLSEQKRCELRNRQLGFVYQFHHLLGEFTVLENVAMPLLIGGETIKDACERAKTILSRVGLAHRFTHKISQLSGGERQRTAVARAMVNHPQCVLADEPTGNLDHNTAHKVYELMIELNQQLQTSFIIVTHDLDLAQRMDKVLFLEAGILKQET